MLLGLVGVSGVGKTYFKEKIVQELGFQAVNTIRTREKRIGEENGKTGLFKTEEELVQLKEEDHECTCFSGKILLFKCGCSSEGT